MMVKRTPREFDVHAFESAVELDAWLRTHHETSPGIWVRLRKVSSREPGASFDELLELSLIYGWSESTRRGHDDRSYLQLITPRRTIGTTSERNRRLAGRLIAEGRMTPAGKRALGLSDRT